jgi:Predicted O-methyltransferase
MNEDRQEMGLMKLGAVAPAARAALDALGIVVVEWHRRDPDSWLGRNLPSHLARVNAPPLARRIEERATTTGSRGPQELWDGYAGSGPVQTRTSDEVRTDRAMGRLFARLAGARCPEVIVEVGTAFGVSGMYWLAGLESSGSGRLYTFEPNAAWAEIARDNLDAIGERFELVVGTFEDNVDDHLRNGTRIELAFVDAIHTSEWVEPQFDLIVERIAPGGLVLFDDITFSDDMAECWHRIATDPRVRASASLSRRVGIVELTPEASRWSAPRPGDERAQGSPTPNG